MYRVLSILCLALSLACDSTSPNEEIPGTYQLQTMNGQPVPSTGPGSSFLILTPDGDWSWVKPEPIIGTWSRVGDVLTFLAYDPPTVIKATLSGGAITFSDGGKSYVFRR